ncbi:MAG: hypothetical protein M5U34_10765 [Chloroflexi bacterium]|nr:hypothetical protein [Chloroflexota bacterium]
MSDDFGDFQDDTFDDTPDWLLDGDEDDHDTVQAVVSDEDEFEQLRRKSARTGSMYDDMDGEADIQASSSSSFSWSSFSSGQRLVLALLIVLDILAIAFGVMVFTNII